MKAEMVDSVPFTVGGLLLVTVAIGLTVSYVTNPFESQSQQASDVDFIRQRIDANAKKVCNDANLDRMPLSSEEYITYEFRGLKKGYLSESGDALVLDYSSGKRRIPLNDICERYEVESFGSGVQKFYLEQNGDTLLIGTKG